MANGVMAYLEEKGIGYDTGYALVPLVAQSDIFDLSVGDAGIRPDAAMGYEAARLAMRGMLKSPTSASFSSTGTARRRNRVQPHGEISELRLFEAALCHLLQTAVNQTGVVK